MRTSNKVAREPEFQAPPTLTPAGREARMIAYAMDLAEEQLRNGTASSQVITHFLKLGTETAKLELERLQNENKLIQAKADEINSKKENKELYAQALQAMSRYRPSDGNED